MRYLATSLAIGANPRKAAEKWLDKIFAESDVTSKRYKIEMEWICKYIFTHPISSPTTIVWGHAEKVV